MEGITYLLLAITLCPIALGIGALAFILAILGGRAVARRGYGTNRPWVVVPVAGVIALVVSCAVFQLMYAPAFPGYYTPRGHPRDKDVIGRWVATSGARELMAERGYPAVTPTIDLNADGSFSATDIPDMIFFDQNLILYSGDGTWQSAWDFQGYWRIELTFDRMDPPWFPDPPLSGPTPCAGRSVPCEGLRYGLDMWNRKPPYVVYANVGGEMGPNLDFTRIGDEHDFPH